MHCTGGDNCRCIPEGLDGEATRILRADAKAKGLGWAEYLREAGIMTEHQEREAKRRERPLRP